MEKLKFKDLSEDRKWEIVDDHIGDMWHEDLVERIVNEELESAGFEEPEISFSGFWSQGDGASFTCKRIDVSLFVSRFWPQMDFQSEQLERYEESQAQGLEALTQLGFSEEEAGMQTPILHLFLEKGSTIFYGSVYRSSHHYVHENSTDLSLDIDNYDIDEPEDRDLDGHSFLPEDEAELLSFYKYLEGWMEEWIRDKNREMYRRLEEEWDAWREEQYNQFEEENEEWRA